MVQERGVQITSSGPTLGVFPTKNPNVWQDYDLRSSVNIKAISKWSGEDYLRGKSLSIGDLWAWWLIAWTMSPTDLV